MDVRRRQRIALLALVAYALACTFSDLWHTHRAVRVEQLHPAVAVDCAIAERVERAGHKHGRPETPRDADTNDGCGHPSDHDDSCAVCRFVAQSSLPSLPVAEPPLGELTNDLRVVPLGSFCTSVPSDCLARAPPAAG
ncbi:MAG TPA: hypothetical protein VND64_10775 [Pirellulales bacterium]|nr:hypothetical protein [Pirellulales bacterium]